MKEKLLTVIAVLGMTAGTAQANLSYLSNDFTTGTTEVQQYAFDVTQAGDLDIYTDRFVHHSDTGELQPVVSLWKQAGSDYQLLGWNDQGDRQFAPGSANDNGLNVFGVNHFAKWIKGDGLNPGVADSGLRASTQYTAPAGIISNNQIGSKLDSLDAGSYLVTVGLFSNTPNGPLLSDGFSEPVGDISLPDISPVIPLTYDLYISSYNGFGNGAVVSEVSAIPVPAAIWFLGSALTGLSVFGRKKATQLPA